MNTLALSSHIYIISNIKVTITHAKIDKYMNDIAVLTHKLMDMDNLEVLFCIVKMGEQVYLIARSKREEINVGEIARHFGGGGHPTASSACIKNLNIEETIEKILSILTSELQIELRAQDIMSSPVISLNEDTTIEETKKMIIRFNHSGFPVVNRKDDLVGIITRQDVERASLHGLGNTPIKTYMSRSLITATPETYINVIHNIMMTNNIGRLPIMDKENKLTGIITRTDILQVLNISKEKGTESYYKKNYNQENKILLKSLQKLTKVRLKVIINSEQRL
ncbi:CBS domain-containing protein [Candidatus Desantisbacteria bacterium]|nr:CBS domain-containing protein [Candidatus Desantisbacteria bacterium]